MPLDDAGKNTAADAVADTYTWLALFNGATELTGGSPAYSRIQVSNASSVAGVVNITGTPYDFNIPAGASVTHFGLFTLQTGGVRGGYEPVSASEGPYAAQGLYRFTGGSIAVA